MIPIVVPAVDKFNEKTNEFLHYESQILQLEHSLLSISKWESKWKKPFPLIQSVKERSKITPEEFIDYVRCMTLNQHVDQDCYENLSKKNVEKIIGYINDPMTATWFSKKEHQKPGPHPIITNELVYYWMDINGIPKDCEKWHFNRLMTLINVHNEKNNPGKKRSPQEIAAQNRALNAQRKAKMRKH